MHLIELVWNEVNNDEMILFYYLKLRSNVRCSIYKNPTIYYIIYYM